MSLTGFKAKMNKSKINKYKINNNNKTNTKHEFDVKYERYKQDISKDKLQNYYPKAEILQRLIRKYWYLIKNDPTIGTKFKKNLTIGFKRNRNIGELVNRAQFKSASSQIGLKMKVISAQKNKNKKRINK
jgi:hypothetical protein